MKRFFSMLLTVAILAGSAVLVSAQDEDMGGGQEKPKKEKKVKERKPSPPLEELTIAGKITKETKGEGEKARTSYTLTDADGNKISLTPPRAAKKGGEADIKLDDFVDQDVTLVGKGTQTEKDGKKRISIKTITSITKGGGGEAGGEAMEAE